MVDSSINEALITVWRESNQADASVAWTKRLRAALEPFSDGAMYASSRPRTPLGWTTR